MMRVLQKEYTFWYDRTFVWYTRFWVFVEQYTCARHNNDAWCKWLLIDDVLCMYTFGWCSFTVSCTSYTHTPNSVQHTSLYIYIYIFLCRISGCLDRRRNNA